MICGGYCSKARRRTRFENPGLEDFGEEGERKGAGRVDYGGT